MNLYFVKYKNNIKIIPPQNFTRNMKLLLSHNSVRSKQVQFTLQFNKMPKYKYLVLIRGSYLHVKGLLLSLTINYMHV
mgnify:CR=1 FL=1